MTRIVDRATPAQTCRQPRGFFRRRPPDERGAVIAWAMGCAEAALRANTANVPTRWRLRRGSYWPSSGFAPTRRTWGAPGLLARPPDLDKPYHRPPPLTRVSGGRGAGFTREVTPRTRWGPHRKRRMETLYGRRIRRIRGGDGAALRPDEGRTPKAGGWGVARRRRGGGKRIAALRKPTVAAWLVESVGVSSGARSSWRAGAC
jgi:hypothetical protein